MIFVTVVHRLKARGAAVLTEEQDIVYREEVKPGSGGAAAVEPPPTPTWARALIPDAVMVFRYSAITFNAHRIHYDADYTREVEGHPALVVNGGLTTLLVLELARAKLGRPLATVATRNVKPLYVGRPVTVCGTAAGDKAELWVLDDGGAVALKASAELKR